MFHESLSATEASMENVIHSKPAQEAINKGAAIVNQIQEGKAPSTELLTETLEAAQQTISQQRMPSVYGQRAAEDVREVMSTAQQFLEEKNQDDLLQRLMLHIKEAAEEAKQVASEAAAEVSSDVKGIAEKGASEVKAQGQDIGESLKSLSLSLVNSPEFRQLLINIVELFQSTVDYSLERVKQHDPARVLEPLAELADQAQATMDDVRYKPISAGKIERAADNAKESVSQAVAETTERAKELGSQIVEDVKQGGIPVDEAKRQQIIENFNRLWNRASSSPESRQAIRGLLDMYDEIKHRMAQLADYAKAQAAGAQLPKMRKADLVWMDLRELLSRFTGREKLDDFLADLNEYMDMVGRDPQVKQFFKNLRNYIDITMRNPELLQNESHQRRAQELFDRSVELFSKWEYNDETEYLLHEARELVESITHDPTLNRLQEVTEKLGKDLILDERGHVNFRVTQDVLGSIRQLVMPLFLDQFAMVPLPRIDISDGTSAYTFENLMFPGRQLLPEHFKIKAKEKLEMDTTSDESNMMAMAKVKLTIASVQLHLDNIKFRFHRGGLISLSDQGTANVSIGGPGSKIIIKWTVLTDANRQTTFKAKKVDVLIDRMRIDILEAEHSMLLPAITTLFNGTIKQRLERSIADLINGQLEALNQKLNQIAIEAANKQRELTEQAQSALQVAAERTQQAVEQAKTVMSDLSEKAASTASEVRRKFNRGQGMTLTDRAKEVLSITGLVDSPVDEKAAAALGKCRKCTKPADKKCGRCADVYYCSKECQVSDWRSHRRTCDDHSRAAPHKALPSAKMGLPAAEKSSGQQFVPASHSVPPSYTSAK